MVVCGDFTTSVLYCAGVDYFVVFHYDHVGIEEHRHGHDQCDADLSYDFVFAFHAVLVVELQFFVVVEEAYGSEP